MWSVQKSFILQTALFSLHVMTPTEIDYFAFALMLLRWTGFLFVFYIIVIIILRLSNYYRIRRCPNCGGELKRSQRSTGDKMVNSITFGMLPLKRYRCYTCYWEGMALPNKSNKGSAHG